MIVLLSLAPLSLLPCHTWTNVSRLTYIRGPVTRHRRGRVHKQISVTKRDQISEGMPNVMTNWGRLPPTSVSGPTQHPLEEFHIKINEIVKNETGSCHKRQKPQAPTP